MKKNIIKKLALMPYAQAHVEIDADKNIHLFSYTTRVASLDKDGWLEVYMLYSTTTRKHIGAFMREYVQFPNGECGTFQTAKTIYGNGYRFNILTGEIEE